ncbi:hypothetical protein HPP92_007058 [Vanilla planifolia]|uniref:Uncharacterized protein n=1 Tax=Vanilla planifolia TaxID=51239 RepID=A0A835VAX0_VANPL|nr:hypothetical protein HPP92_007058 [Vanilla planifolia]
MIAAVAEEGGVEDGYSPGHGDAIKFAEVLHAHFAVVFSTLISAAMLVDSK